MKKFYFWLTVTALIACGTSSCSLFRKTVMEAEPTSNNSEANSADSQHQSVDPSTHHHSSKNEVDASIDEILNGEWTVLDIEGTAVNPPSIEDNAVSITLKLNDKGSGELYCFTGCNYLNGNVTFNPVSGSVIVDGSYLKTMMACDPASEATEMKMTSALNVVSAYKVEHVEAAYYLYLNDASGRTVITTRRWDNNFLNGAWRVTNIGEREIGDDADIYLVFDVAGERLHGNTGCNIINGKLHLMTDRINGLEFNDIATTLRGCPDTEAALEHALLLDLEEVTSCQAVGGGNTVLLKNDAGQVLIRLTRRVI